MKKTNSNLTLLSMIFVVCLVIANVVSGRVLHTGVNLFGSPVTLPGAALCYCLTFLATDVISELWGKKEANRIVKFGFFGQLLATALIMLTGYLPVAEGFENVAEAYETLLGQSFWFAVGSLVAYLISQTWDVWFFHKIRTYFVNKDGNNSKRWIWNNLSTMTSQIIDTVIFIFIAFGIGVGLPLPVLINMAIGQYIFKFVLALIDTPFFYILTHNKKEKDSCSCGCGHCLDK